MGRMTSVAVLTRSHATRRRGRLSPSGERLSSSMSARRRAIGRTGDPARPAELLPDRPLRRLLLRPFDPGPPSKRPDLVLDPTRAIRARASAGRGSSCSEPNCMRVSAPTVAAVKVWLRTFEAHVRAADFEAARPMFASDVAAFGTYAAIVTDRTRLERDQWRRVWPAIRGFRFRVEALRCLGGSRAVCAVVPWDSRGVRSDGATFPRPGRATLFLVRRAGRWVAVHSHFSLAPAGERSRSGSARSNSPRSRTSRRLRAKTRLRSAARRASQAAQRP